MTPTTYGYDTAYCLKSHYGVRDVVGRSGCFKFKLSANSVMRGRVNAIRTFKSLVADLKYNRKIWRKYIKPNCLQQIFRHLFSLIFIIFPIFPISYSEVFYEFLEIRIPSCEKFISLQNRIKSSLRNCKIKKDKETRSFPNRSPFIILIYVFLL